MGTDELMVTRRQTLQGMAWAAPAIVVAKSVPAAASSTSPTLAEGIGVEVHSLDAKYRESYWVGDRSAVSLEIYIQNIGNDAPDATGFALTVTVPVSGADEAWGIQSTEGVPSGDPWTLASYSRSGGMATLVLAYTGGTLTHWGGVSVSNLWFATADALKDVKNSRVTATVNASYANGATSVRVATAKVK